MDYVAGFTSDHFLDPDRKNWQATGPRPISWAMWYPADLDSPTEEQLGGAKDRPYLSNGPVSLDAAISGQQSTYPLIVMSHGTGGSALGMGWFGRRLAEKGYIVVGANHHGNTAIEPYQPEGFLCAWERSRDLSTLLDKFVRDPKYGDHIDQKRIFAAGFSLGGHTVIASAGAVYANDQFLAWLADQPGVNGPREFPDLGDHVEQLMENSAPFRTSMTRHGQSYHDPRIKAVFAMAPAPTVRGFNTDSLAEITVPIYIQTGAADQECPVESCTNWLGAQNPSFQIEILDGDVGHYIFLSEPTKYAIEDVPEISIDPAGIDRRTIHQHAAATADRFFSATE